MNLDDINVLSTVFIVCGIVFYAKFFGNAI